MKKGFNIIAGPCSIESEQQIVDIAYAIKKAGASALRGGAYKPRTSPHSFAGLGKHGLEFLSTAKKLTGLATVSEITSIQQLDFFDDVDIIQVGARSMQNFELLKELGSNTSKTILLKRGFGNTVNEWLLSAEYISHYGNPNIILCERGIRTFSNSSRFFLDVAAIPQAKQAGFVVYADPSHAAGQAHLVPSLSFAATAVGADGLIIECHIEPKKAQSDSDQAIDMDTLTKTIKKAHDINDLLHQH